MNGQNIRTVDNDEYLGMLKELILDGKEVNLLVSGSSMAPFIIHHRDSVQLSPITDPLKKSDIVFFQRADGQYVLHRICKVYGGDVEAQRIYDIIGDGQRQIEYGVKREQIFSVVTAVCRKGTWIRPGDFWWRFFAGPWLNWIGLRNLMLGIYGVFHEQTSKVDDGSL